ncbi:unnamed protein product [marine sediment metagenome]|uniref:Uncharacterized protein n=1 Tax=marine sediment metagenome TaxID=412755 RepID=X1D321_9ZZZZ
MYDFSHLFQSQGRTKILFWWGIFSTTILAIAFVIGLRWDIEGVAIAYAIVVVLLIYSCFLVAFKLINLKFSHFIKQFRFMFLAVAGMGGIVFGFRLVLENTIWANDLIILILTIIFGIVSYIGLLFILDKDIFKEVFQLLKSSFFLFFFSLTSPI